MTVPAAIRPAPAHTDRSSSPAERPPVSVVICAYTARRLAILEAAASAAREQLRVADELIVVVDHNPELLEAVRALLGDDDDTGVKVSSNRNRLGLSGARNTGVAAARGELVAFLDDDAVPEPGWLEQLLEPFADPTVIGTGGVASPVWEDRPPAWLPEEFLWVVGCSYRGLPDVPAEIRNPIGANMAFRREAIRQAGGFADGIGRVGHTPLGCEETEFAIRAASRTGGRIVQQPTAAVGHLVTVDRLSLRYFARRCWAEGISKAFVSKLAGSGAALASERRYATRTLPTAILMGLRDGFRGDRTGFKRAAAVAAGLLVTVAGYLRGSARSFETLATD